ncbi:recombinase family protein [Thermoproteus tenax]|uniref:Site-specific recombinase, resolvase family n=1 Tax=Thermoproteus tenax (strain ATCC 35583 / DSM 2078 / JCM 9277 / NBRC 100435 / Kra 1) TaxID=768679 RepID=G4RLJ5_THETK|nr:recombinase family protein [Thermoproteus tenax]CCC82440.1 putative site-specific recombinase, resolvase family [Thermoproteus tenax Kra 1]
MIPAIAYIRVSTEEQDPENQREYLEKWAPAHGLAIIKYYVDVGVSGAIEPWERPAFKRLMEEVPQMSPKPKVLLVYEVSRLVRSFQELFKLLDVVEEKLGLVVVSASEREQALQTVDGMYRQFLRAVLAFVAAMEREFIRQRTKAALVRAKAAGKITNVAERVSPEIAMKIVEMRRAGASLREIGRAFGLSTYEVRRILSAAGEYRPDETTCPRCFSKMRVAERSAKIADGLYKVVERLYCPNCGYEEVVERA